MHSLRAKLAWAVAASAVAVAAVLAVGSGPRQGSGSLPAQLSDQEFWRLARDFSEPDGSFHSENLVSNEIRFQTIIPELIRTVPPGRAYVGVGSEQNFTYMAAVRPGLAFIVDLRRGNQALHLIYKTLFERAADRAEFVSLMFSRPKPSMLTTDASVDEIFAAVAGVPPSEAHYAANLETIETHLTKTHGFDLLEVDRAAIRFVYRAWFDAGPDIHYQLTGRGGRGGGFPTYADLMTTTDGEGRHRSFLASDEAFRFLKDLQTRNLVIPVIGNFGGPMALRSVADWLRDRGALVGAFYTSNVEQYLRNDGLWMNFCRSAATFPTDEASSFIRSERGGFAGVARRGIGGFWLGLEPMHVTTAACTGR